MKGNAGKKGTVKWFADAEKLRGPIFGAKRLFVREVASEVEEDLSSKL